MSLRFAPSPTGYLHVGNARTAIINWLISRQMGESFILRFDDTDTERSSEKFISSIKEDLNWLGLTWDFSFKQSERTKNYEEAFHKLKDNNLIYPCYETDDELSLKRSLQRKSGRPPVYDRAALKLTKEDKSKIESQGKLPHWRFKLPDKDFCGKMLFMEKLSLMLNHIVTLC